MKLSDLILNPKIILNSERLNNVRNDFPVDWTPATVAKYFHCASVSGDLVSTMVEYSVLKLVFTDNTLLVF
jgi:hypothetical protein